MDKEEIESAKKELEEFLQRLVNEGVIHIGAKKHILNLIKIIE